MNNSCQRVIAKMKVELDSKEELLKKLLIFLSVLWLFVTVLLPLAVLFIKAFADNAGNFVGFANFKKYFSTPSLFRSIYNTFYISITTTFITVWLAFWYAYALSRTEIMWKNFFKHIALAPLFAPTLMHGIALIYLFGNKGLFTTGFFGILPAGIDIHLYGPVGIIVSEVIYTFPQAFLILMVSLTMVDYRMYEAAETLGANWLRKFLTVTIPGVKYGLISASFVCFTLSFTDFGAPKVVGGQYNVLATDIYKQVIGQQNFAMGAVLGIVLLFPAFLAFIADRLIQRKQSATISAKSIPYKVKKNILRDRALFANCLVISGLILVWIATVAAAALVKSWPYNLSLTFMHFKFEGFNSGLKYFWNSIIISGLSALVGTALTFGNAYLIEKTRYLKAIRQAGYFLSTLPLALPGLVIGLSYVLFFNAPLLSLPYSNIKIPNPFHLIYGTVFILVLSNIVHFYSVPFLTATTALKKLDREFELVSESMAVPFYKTFLHVTVPMSLPAILEIGMYFFVNSMTTVSAVIFLYTSKLKLASIAIVNMDDAGEISSAAAMSVLIVLTNIIVRSIYELVVAGIKKSTDVWQKRN